MDGFDETVVRTSLKNMLESGRADELEEAAHKLTAEFIKESIDYELMDENAEAMDAFCRKSMSRETLSQPGRFALAEAFSWEYQTALVHLDHSYATGVLLNLTGCACAISEIKSSLEASPSWGRGPDASLDARQVDALEAAADKLEEIRGMILSVVDSVMQEAGIQLEGSIPPLPLHSGGDRRAGLGSGHGC